MAFLRLFRTDNYTVLLLSIVAYSYHTYWRKRTYVDQFKVPAMGRRKIVPSWVSNWLGPIQSRLSFRRSNRGPSATTTMSAAAGASIDSLPAKHVSHSRAGSEVDSDIIELTLPHRALSTHSRAAVSMPKPLGVPLASRG